MVEFEDPKPDEKTPVEYIPRWYETRPRRRSKPKLKSSCYEVDLKTGKATGLTVLQFSDGY